MNKKGYFENGVSIKESIHELETEKGLKGLILSRINKNELSKFLGENNIKTEVGDMTIKGSGNKQAGGDINEWPPGYR